MTSALATPDPGPAPATPVHDGRPLAQHRQFIVPPLSFQLVATGVYRSGYPLPINFPMLERLGLKTIMSPIPPLSVHCGHN